MLNNFSPNMLKTYKTCPKKFYYQYIEGVRVPQSSTPFEKGKKIHALANYYLQGVNITRIETALTPVEKDLWNLLLDNPFYKKDCLKTEFQLSCKLNLNEGANEIAGCVENSPVWIGGRLDAVVHDGDEYYILDYKTGSTPKNPEYDYQTMVYLLCLDRYLKQYDSLSFVYINLKDKQNYVIKFNEQAKIKYEQQVIEMCGRILKDTLYTPNINNCKFCEFAKICTERE